MRQRAFMSSIILLAIAMTILLETRKLPIGSPSSPNMGFWPLILGVLLAILSLLLIWKAIKEKGEERSISEEISASPKGPILALGALFAFAFLFEFLGYMICTFLLLSFLLFTFSTQKWWLSLLVAFISSIVSYLMFVRLLGAPLPVGILGV
ncbi:tripartite tricarboxylate transporter TctB family protein [Thermodesulfobacteriota bacterium]